MRTAGAAFVAVHGVLILIPDMSLAAI